MRVLALFGLAAIAAAVPLQDGLSKRGTQSLNNEVAADVAVLTKRDGTLAAPAIGSALETKDVAGLEKRLLNIDVTALQNAQRILQTLKQLLTAGSGLNTQVTALLGQASSIFQGLGLAKRGIDLNASINLMGLAATIDALLGQINGILGRLGLNKREEATVDVDTAEFSSVISTFLGQANDALTVAAQ